MEIEIKLAPVAAHIARKILDEEHFFTSKVSVLRLHSHYYDTPKRTLGAIGFSLRLREENGKSVCCLKGPSQGIVRQEFELPASSVDECARALLQISDIPDAAKKALADGCFEELYGAVFTRTLRLAEYNGSVIEVSADRGHLVRDNRFCSISELELELKSGKSEDVQALAGYLCEKYGISISNITKARRAAGLTQEAFMEMKPVNPFFVASELLNYCVDMGWIAYSLDSEKKLTYYLTETGKKVLPESFGLNFDCPCAAVKGE